MHPQKSTALHKSASQSDGNYPHSFALFLTENVFARTFHEELLLSLNVWSQ